MIFLPTLQLERKKGFTLAELLIAIFIFSVVVSMTYGAYSMTFKVINNANTNSRYGERARIALERMTDDLESLYLGSSGVFVGETNNYGEFRGDELTFTSRAHLIFHKGELPKGYATVSYTVVEEEGSGRLQLFRADIPYLPGAAEQEDKGLLLCDSLREVAITYFDEDDNEADSWSASNNSFSGARSTPKMVRIRLGFVSEDNQEETIYFSTAVAVPSL